MKKQNTNVTHQYTDKALPKRTIENKQNWKLLRLTDPQMYAALRHDVKKASR